MGIIDKADHAHMIAYHNKGYGFEEIAKKIGVSRQAVRYFFAQRGIGRTDEFKRHVPLIIKMVGEGKTISEIATHLGKSYAYVYDRIRRHRIIVPKPERKPITPYSWVQETLELRNQKKTPKEISAIIGRSVSTVMYRLRKLEKLGY